MIVAALHAVQTRFSSRRVVAIAAALACAALPVATAQAAGPKPPKPVISGFAAAPATVASGGSTSVSASVSEATECRISSNKAVTGLPASVACGAVERELTLPSNAATKAAKYALTLTAKGPGGKAKAKITVELLPETTLLSVHKEQRLAGEARYTSEDLAAQPTETVEYLITIVNTGERAQVLKGFRDTQCVGIAGPAKTELASGESTTATCHHTLGSVEVGHSYVNVASIEGDKERHESNKVEVEVEEERIVSITGGDYHSCALMSTAHLDCWGSDYYGQLGNGMTRSQSQIPIVVPGVNGVRAVALGGDHTCALFAAGPIDCWGFGHFGQIGDGTTTEDNPNPVEVVPVGETSAVYGGGDGSCASLTSGPLYCWGMGAEGIATGHFANSDVPVEVEGFSHVAQASVTPTNTCVLLTDPGSIDCWGENSAGQLGDGTESGNEAWFPPAEVSGIHDATQIVGGSYFSCALLSTGHVDCWGNNPFGELGDGTPPQGDGFYRSSDVPAEVVGISDATQLASGGGHTCAVLATGHVDCWGYNSSGQLGDGSTANSDNAPVEVSGLENATELDAGAAYTCALRTTNRVACWGINGDGELGDGSNSNSDVPVEVVDLN